MEYLTLIVYQATLVYFGMNMHKLCRGKIVDKKSY